MTHLIKLLKCPRLALIIIFLIQIEKNCVLGWLRLYRLELVCAIWILWIISNRSWLTLWWLRLFCGRLLILRKLKPAESIWLLLFCLTRLRNIKWILRRSTISTLIRETSTKSIARVPTPNRLIFKQTCSIKLLLLLWCLFGGILRSNKTKCIWSCRLILAKIRKGASISTGSPIILGIRLTILGKCTLRISLLKVERRIGILISSLRHSRFTKCEWHIWSSANF